MRKEELIEKVENTRDFLDQFDGWDDCEEDPYDIDSEYSLLADKYFPEGQGVYAFENQDGSYYIGMTIKPLMERLSSKLHKDIKEKRVKNEIDEEGNLNHHYEYLMEYNKGNNKVHYLETGDFDPRIAENVLISAFMEVNGGERPRTNKTSGKAYYMIRTEEMIAMRLEIADKFNLY